MAAKKIDNYYELFLTGWDSDILTYRDDIDERHRNIDKITSGAERGWFTQVVFNLRKEVVYVNRDVGSVSKKAVVGLTVESLYKGDVFEAIDSAIDEASANPGKTVIRRIKQPMTSGVAHFYDEIVRIGDQVILTGMLERVTR